MESSLGIAGGENCKALWFIGLINAHTAKDPKLIYLDPHFVQEASKSTKMSDDDLLTFSCQEVRYMALSRICSSLCFGFYIKN